MGNDDRLINALKAINTTLKAIAVTLTIIGMIAMTILIKIIDTGSGDLKYVFLLIVSVLGASCVSALSQRIE